MVTDNYPDNILPLPDVRNYSSNFTSNILRTNLESGFAKQRRLGSAYPDVFKCTMQFSLEQLGIFEYFVDKILIGGQKWFNMKHLDGSGFVDGVFRIVPSGSDIFTKRYLSTYLVEVAFTTERQTRKIISLEDYTNKTTPGLDSTSIDKILEIIENPAMIYIDNIGLFSAGSLETIGMFDIPDVFENIWWELVRDDLPTDDTVDVVLAIDGLIDTLVDDVDEMAIALEGHYASTNTDEDSNYSPYKG